jgi:hypothetical protein
VATIRRTYPVAVTQRWNRASIEAMATKEELLAALDERLLEGIRGKSTPEGVVKLAEARAWLTDPAQPHGATITT